MGSEMLNFSGQSGVVFIEDGPVYAPSQLQVGMEEEFIVW